MMIRRLKNGSRDEEGAGDDNRWVDGVVMKSVEDGIVSEEEGGRWEG